MLRLLLLAAGQLVFLNFLMQTGRWVYLLSLLGAVLAGWLYFNEEFAGDERLRLRNYDALEYTAEIAGWAGAWSGILLLGAALVSFVVQLGTGAGGGLLTQWDTAYTTFSRRFLTPGGFLGFFGAGAVIAAVQVLQQGPE